MTSEAESVLLLVALLREQRPFVHVRFGDGDVMFASGVGSKITADGEEWTPALAKRMNDAWFNLSVGADRLLLGDLRTYAVSDGCEAQWDDLLERQRMMRPASKQPITFVHMEALRVGFGYALPFYEELRDDQRDKLFVAPPPLGPLLAPRLNAKWCGVPLRVAHKEADRIVALIERERPALALFAAGRGGKIMQGKLAQSMPNLTQIDIGSGLDLLIDDGVRRGTDLKVNRKKVLDKYRKVGLTG